MSTPLVIVIMTHPRDDKVFGVDAVTAGGSSISGDKEAALSRDRRKQTIDAVEVFSSPFLTVVLVSL